MLTIFHIHVRFGDAGAGSGRDAMHAVADCDKICFTRRGEWWKNMANITPHSTEFRYRKMNINLQFDIFNYSVIILVALLLLHLLLLLQSSSSSSSSSPYKVFTCSRCIPSLTKDHFLKFLYIIIQHLYFYSTRQMSAFCVSLIFMFYTL